MRKFVICQNIDRYRRLLGHETNEARRRMLERLLAEEEEIWERMQPTGSRIDPDPELANSKPSSSKPSRKLDG